MSESEALALLREFRNHVVKYAGSWQGDSGSQHNPIWGRVSRMLACPPANDPTEACSADAGECCCCARIAAAHDARVTELLAVINREVERRRAAEARLRRNPVS